MGAFGLAIQIEPQEAINSRIRPVGTAIKFLFHEDLQESLRLWLSCQSLDDKNFEVVMAEKQCENGTF